MQPVGSHINFSAQVHNLFIVSGKYRFGFNSQEKDDEIYGVTGSMYNYGFRLYDSRIGRFPTPDPLIVKEQKYPWYSPYQFAGNKPIMAVDLDGLEEKEANVLIQSMGAGQAKEVTVSSLDIQKTLWSDAGMIVGGVVAIVMSIGTTSPVIAGLLGVTGSYSIAGGTTKAGLDIAGQHKAANVLPATYAGCYGKSVDVIAGWEGKYAERIGDFIQNVVMPTGETPSQIVINTEQKIESGYQGIKEITSNTSTNIQNTNNTSTTTNGSSNNSSSTFSFHWSWETDSDKDNTPPIPMKPKDNTSSSSTKKPPSK